MCCRLAVLLATAIAILLPLEFVAQPTVPDVPKEIAVPPGYKLLFKFEAKGVQIYRAEEGRDDKPEWVFDAPLVDLFDSKGGKAGCHYEGPSWEAVDGSKVVRDKAEDVKSAPAPNAKENISWLLIRVKAEKGKDGTFSPAVYIQRLQTEGGKAPAEPPQARRDESRGGVQGRVLFLRQSEVSRPPN